MGIGMDAGLDAEQDSLMLALGGADGVQTVYLLKGVDDDGADAAVHGHLQLGDRLVVAVEVQMPGIKARLQRRIKLAAGDHIRMDTLAGQNGIDEPGAQGLAGVGDLIALAEIAAHGLGKITAVLPDLSLAHNIGRGAVFTGDLHQIHIVQAEMPVVPNGKAIAVIGVHVSFPPMLFVYLRIIDPDWFPFPRKRR